MSPASSLPAPSPTETSVGKCTAASLRPPLSPSATRCHRCHPRVWGGSDFHMQRQRRVGRSPAWGHLLWGCSSPEPQRWGTEPQARPMQGGDTPTGDLHSGVPSAAAAAKRLAEPALAHGQAVPPRPVRAAWAWGAAATRHRPAHVALLPPGGGHPPGLSPANCGSTLAEEGAVPGATRTPGRRVLDNGAERRASHAPSRGDQRARCPVWEQLLRKVPTGDTGQHPVRLPQERRAQVLPQLSLSSSRPPGTGVHSQADRGVYGQPEGRGI